MGQWSRTGWLALWIGAAYFTAVPQNGMGGMPFMLSVNEAEAPARCGPWTPPSSAG
jgi:hypothetical protein